MRVKVYTCGKKKVIGDYTARNVYESTFYHRMMPTLSAEDCRKILNSVSPNFKIESEMFVLEDAETGYTGIQRIHRQGTVLNF